MKRFLAALSFFPLLCLAQSNAISVSFSNEGNQHDLLSQPGRTQDVSTQIIRMNADVEGQERYCDDIVKTIERFLVKHIPKQEFLYNTLIYCQYHPETHHAVNYRIESIFDPLNDNAILHLHAFLEQYNGSDFFGTPLNVESAKGMIVALRLAAGTRRNPDKPPFMEYRSDQNQLYFKNNYTARTSFYNDVIQHFYSNKPEDILPLLDKWLFPHAGELYQDVLAESNHVELIPERIFLMEQGEPIFVSQYKAFFKHHCSHYDNHRCLKTD